MKSIRLTVVLAIVIMATSACKTKQKVAEIPAGAKIEATAPKIADVAPDRTTSQVREAEVREAEVKEAEVTRNENFTYVDGEKEAMKYKYHVVVGSFSKQENAKGLHTKLVSEGYKSIIVVNERGMYRVLISSFNDYKQAHLHVKDISKRFPDAWVLVQK